MNKEINKLMKKMCEYVGVDYKTINFKTPNWFLEHSWTEEEEKDYINWLVEQLSTNKELRKTLMKHPSLKTKKRLKRIAKEFVFTYGWKLEGQYE